MRQFLFAYFFVLSALPASAAGGMILEGRVTDPKGRGVSGAELRLIDPSGKVQAKTLSNAKGTYRFPAILDLRPYGIKISHIWFKPVKVENALAGTSVVASPINQLKPAESVALAVSRKTVTRDFQLMPSQSTPRNAVAGRVNPNLAEYYYQRALLLLGRNMKSEALTYLTLYVQTGQNPRQVNRALELIVENQ